MSTERLPVAPGMTNGVRHEASCDCLHTPAFEVARLPCNCGAAKATDISVVHVANNEIQGEWGAL